MTEFRTFSSFDTLESLRVLSAQVLQQLDSISNECAHNVRETLSKWELFCEDVLHRVYGLQDERTLLKQQLEARSKDLLELWQSFAEAQGLWKDSVSDLELGLKEQQQTRLRMETDYLLTLHQFETEVSSVLELPQTPSLRDSLRSSECSKEHVKDAIRLLTKADLIDFLETLDKAADQDPATFLQVLNDCKSTEKTQRSKGRDCLQEVSRTLLSPGSQSQKGALF